MCAPCVAQGPVAVAPSKVAVKVAVKVALKVALRDCSLGLSFPVSVLLFAFAQCGAFHSLFFSLSSGAFFREMCDLESDLESGLEILK